MKFFSRFWLKKSKSRSQPTSACIRDSHDATHLAYDVDVMKQRVDAKAAINVSEVLHVHYLYSKLQEYRDLVVSQTQAIRLVPDTKNGLRIWYKIFLPNNVFSRTILFTISLSFVSRSHKTRQKG